MVYRQPDHEDIEMIDNDKQLERLRKEVEEQAAKEADSIISEAKKKAEEMLSEERSQLEKERGLAALSMTGKFEAYERKRLSEVRSGADRKVLLHRNGLVEDLFSEIREELEAFVKSENYADYLKKAVEKANGAEKICEGTVILCRDCDRAAAEKAAEGYPVTAETDRSIEIGGITVQYPKGIAIDLTLDTALENEREAFSADSAMQL